MDAETAHRMSDKNAADAEKLVKKYAQDFINSVLQRHIMWAINTGLYKVNIKNYVTAIQNMNVPRELELKVIDEIIADMRNAGYVCTVAGIYMTIKW